MHASIHEAKTNLSDLIRRAQAGESVVITSGREKTPIARLEPITPVVPKRLGILETPGWTLPRSFWDDLPEEELRLWEGRDE